MKFIEPSVVYWPQEPGIDGVWKQIARATRVCYQSTPRNNGETEEKFVKRVILKQGLVSGSLDDLGNCVFNFSKVHGATLEHGTVYLKVPEAASKANDIKEFYKDSPYSVCISRSLLDGNSYITTNMRCILESHRWGDLKYLCEPTEYHEKRYTFSVITDIGVTREMNRHRAFSICEQSTRYCDFTKDKFGGELTFVKPSWLSTKEDKECFYHACRIAEASYKELRKAGWKPEEARQILPLGLKTQAVYTAYEDDWAHFLALRAHNASGKAHPNIVQVASMIEKSLNGIKQ